LRGVENSFIRGEADLIAAIGLDERIVVATEDVTLVEPRSA
jgi:mannose-1-phosphate guanylyltransferase